MDSTQKESEKLILIAIDDDKVDLEINLQELEELVLTSGATPLGTMTQKRDKPHQVTYFGKGKLEELKDYVSLVDATGIVADDELSSNQIKNMSEYLGVKVMDRTMIILDIFAKRALSSEGKAQVELAQLKYNSSRLIGLGKILSRQGGTASGSGIGSRGPGEKKLELDRRNIRERISELEKDIEEIKVQRKTQREKRNKNKIPVVSLVGYTNAGKSTILNLLTDSEVLSQDMLFATLDTTTRKLILSTGQEILLTDTVGFIQKLPHTLIRAFNATLEELKYADILIHVVDYSSKYYQKQMETVYETLEELQVKDKPIITVYNKKDLVDKNNILNFDSKATYTVQLSALTGEGTDEFLAKVEKIINSFKKEIEVIIPFSEGALIDEIHRSSTILEKEYREQGVYLKISADNEIENKVNNYLLEN